MEQSLYFELAQKFLPTLTTEVVEQMNELNGAAQAPLLYRQFLTPSYTSDSSWQGIKAKYNRVAADIVALGAPVASKQRDTTVLSGGEIPKMSIMLSLTEKQMKDIDTLTAKPNVQLRRIIEQVFADVPRCIDGIYERVEQMFLTGLSTGKALSTDNNGAGALVDFKFPEENLFATSSDWSDPSATVIADIETLFDKAVDDRSTITDVFIDDVALRKLYKNNDMKAQHAFTLGFAGTNIPMLAFAQIQQDFQSRWGVNVHRVARRIKTELNGQFKKTNPWKEGMIVFTCTDRIGDLVWTDTAESTRRDPNVVYSDADEFILVSKYSERNPFAEYTKAEAMAVPVISNVDQIYRLDTTAVKTIA